jgi:photosystem II stability/assembly factor-like uncharacterized protein
MDGGRTWESIHRGMLDDSDVFSIEVNASNPKQVFASACSGIYGSKDRGSTWTKLGIPRDSRRTYTIRLNPGDPSAVYAGTSRGFWKSADGGLTWRQVSPLVVRAIAFDSRDKKRFLMATDDGGVVETNDGGETAGPSNAGFTNRKIHAVAATEGGFLTSTLYDAGRAGLYRFLREEGRWESLAANGGLNVLSIAPVDRTRFLAATFRGLMKSTDGARTWTQVPAPWGSARVQSLAALPGTPAVALAATAKGIYRSEDLGESWKLVTTTPIEALYAMAGAGDMVLGTASDGCAISKDRGATWEKSSKPGIDMYDLAISGEGVILAATARGLYRSVDGAGTWQMVKGPLGTGTVRAVAFHPTRRTAFAVHQKTVYISTDGGETWSALPSDGLECCRVQSLVVEPEVPDRLYAFTKAHGLFVMSLAAPRGEFRGEGRPK